MGRTVIDVNEMRRLNKVTVLNAIRNNSLTSRAAISKVTGLNKATVSSLVDQLIQEEFATEVGLGNSKGGRKPIMLTFNSEAALSIGVDVQIHSMRIVMCNLNQEIKRERVVSIHTKPMSANELAVLIKTEVQAMLEHVPQTPHGVIGIGIALPGLVNYSQGYVHYIPNLGLTDLPLASLLQTELGIPVFIDNDANCGAWAEFRHYPYIQSLVYVNVGIGIGAGLVMNGQVYRGHNGIAGEYGHMTVSPMGRKCSCGNYGCWEQYASEIGLYTHWADGQSLSPDERDLLGAENLVPTLVRRMELGDSYAKRAFHRLGDYLGVGIANILNTLNPELVVLGGRISVAKELILPQIETALSYRALLGTRCARVVTAQEPARAIGAAGIVAEETLLRSFDAPL